jgi:hypothetical protein
MSMTIHVTFLPQDDPDAAISFYCAYRDPAGNMVRIQEWS